MLALLLAAALAQSAAAADRAAALRGEYATSADALRDSDFGRPLELRSADSSGQLRGEVYALTDHPLPEVARVFAEPARWCEMLALAPQTRDCRALPGGAAVDVGIGRRFDQPADEAHRVEFDFAVGQSTPQYFQAELDAERGPLGTRDYRIVLEAIPVAGDRTFLHFSYAYAYGLTARMATFAYLSTRGSGKHGFTVTGRRADGSPIRVDGLRGAVERNAMRHYLAIEAHLAAAALPKAQRFVRSLQRWLDDTARYPQIAEADREAYAAVKREQIRTMRSHANGGVSTSGRSAPE